MKKGKVYFDARQDGSYKLWEIIKFAPEFHDIEVQSYILDFANQTLMKSIKTRFMTIEQLENIGVEVDEDTAQGMVIGIFDKVG